MEVHMKKAVRIRHYAKWQKRYSMKESIQRYFKLEQRHLCSGCNRIRDGAYVAFQTRANIAQCLHNVLNSFNELGALFNQAIRSHANRRINFARNGHNFTIIIDRSLGGEH